jgi:hypothetical protein
VAAALARQVVDLAVVGPLGAGHVDEFTRFTTLMTFTEFIRFTTSPRP